MKHLLLLMFACTTITVNAQEKFTVGNLTYTVTSPTTVEVTKLDSKVKDAVEIPEKVTNTDAKQYTVTSIGEEACKWSDAVSITLPETVDSIKKSAFSGCKITSITFPKNLRYIGSYAFSSTKLTSIDVPATVEEINDHAFFGSSSNPSLASVKLHEGLKKIGDGAFYSSALTEIEIPASVTTLGKSVFLRNRLLKKVVFHDGLLSIGQGTFNDCRALTEFTLPNTLKKIEEEAFLNAKAIKSLNIPKSLETIGSCAFASTNLTTITLDADNKNFVLKDGVLYTKDYKVLQLAPLKGLKNYQVESACLGIAGGAFWGSELESITLSDNIVAIGYGAFLGSQLKSINWPKYLSYIEEQAFANTQFTELTLPSSVYYIADGCFASCKKLTKVTMPSGVMQVYAHAFHNCEQLTQFVAKGSTAPEFMSYYESYDAPFYGIASPATLIVPKGAIKSYTDAGWGDFFNIDESETASLTVKSVTPEKESNLDKNAQFSFSITFNENLQLVNKNPEVQIRQDYIYSAVYINPTGTPQWTARLDGNNTLTIFGNDSDGFLDSFTAKEGKTYYVTIPAGVVKDNTGAVNDQMTITYYGPKPSTGIETLKGETSSNSKVVARYNLNGQAVNAAQKGVQIVKYADGTIRKIVVK
ncbi:MAG: leucine-rich repeat protein [Prevotella fusca]|uniref:leucine-rich repeat protein n=1 Tax=Prevotella fusca TaxID=589436 RepID=UPI003F9FDA5B